MFNVIKKKIIYFVVAAFLCIVVCPQNTKGFEGLSEHRQVNLIDAAAFTIAAGIINDLFLKNGKYHKLSLWKAIAYGGGCWLTGEILEMLYKKVYKRICKKGLSKTLGSTKFDRIGLIGMGINHKRLLRRVITFAILFLVIYEFEKKDYLKSLD